MVVSINPFKQIDKYEDHTIPDYQTKPREQLMPHLFAVAQNAYASLVSGGPSSPPTPSSFFFLPLRLNVNRRFSVRRYLRRVRCRQDRSDEDRPQVPHCRLWLWR